MAPDLLSFIGPLVAGAVIATLVSAFFQPVGEAIRSAPTQLRGWLMADHSAIQGCQFHIDQGGRSRFYVNVACGPSRHHTQPKLPHGDLIESWVAQKFPAVSLVVKHLDDTLMRLEESGEPQTGASDKAVVLVWANGLLDVSLPISHAVEDDQLTIRAQDIAACLLVTIEALMFGYRSLFRRGWSPRRRRLDWKVSISASISTSTGHQPWCELRFPKRVPRAKPLGQRPAHTDLGRDELRGSTLRLNPRSAVRVVLQEFCRTSGYREYDGPIEDVLTLLR